MFKKLSFLALTLMACFFSTNAFSEQNVFIFLGPPGAGKGVLCKKFSKESQIPHISTGDLLREVQANKNSPLAIEVAEYMREGQLVPDDLIVKILLERIQAKDCKKGFILDGFPRTLNQAKILDKALPNQDNLVVVNLKVQEEIVLKRLLGRRTCSHCTQPYHVEYFPPKQNGICDDCGGKLITRSDDCEVAIRNRFEVFKNQFEPIQEYYKHTHNWVEIEAASSVESSYSTLLEKVNAINTDLIISNK